MIRNELTSSCPLYCPDGNQRFAWYPPTGSPPAHYYPTLWMDGIDDQTGAWSDVNYTWSVYSGMINARLAVPSPLELDFSVEYGARGDTGTVHMEVVATDTIPFSKLRWRFGIVEDGLTSGSKHYDQILREYVTTHVGDTLSISEGDTVSRSEEFVMDPTWVVENCRIVVFVQNGKDVTPLEQEREVLQAIQKPVIAPTPERVTDLTITLSEENLILDWSPVATDTNGNPVEVDYYQVYRDTLGFFEPGSDPFGSTAGTFYVDDSGVVGDAGTHYYYAVTAVAGGKESEHSGGVGEFDKVIVSDK